MFADQQKAITNFEPFECTELLFVPWQVVYKYSDNSFMNKPTLLNFVPQFIQEIYVADWASFYRLACAIVPQAHISLMIRLLLVLMIFLTPRKSLSFVWRNFYQNYQRVMQIKTLHVFSDKPSSQLEPRLVWSHFRTLFFMSSELKLMRESK